MKKKLLTISFISSLTLAGQVNAADDVYVDLSVLDNIPQDSIGFVASQPLFPEVKKQNKPIQHKFKKAKKRPQKKVIQQPKEVTLAEKALQPVAEDVQKQAEPKIVNPFNEKAQIAEPQNLLPESIKEDAINPISAEVKSIQKGAAESNPTLETKELPEENNEIIKEEQEEKNLVTTSEAEKQATEQTENVSENILSAVKPMEQKEASEVVLQPKEIYALSFDEDSYELTPEAMQKLDKIAQLFDSERKKKISIKAYNYDNGTESFRKKRNSLNRATEVRSYFLNHGFKNFSIKIINTTADNEYKDTVEIEEID